jgi:hypothetical protein
MNIQLNIIPPVKPLVLNIIPPVKPLVLNIIPDGATLLPQHILQPGNITSKIQLNIVPAVNTIKYQCDHIKQKAGKRSFSRIDPNTGEETWSKINDLLTGERCQATCVYDCKYQLVDNKTGKTLRFCGARHYNSYVNVINRRETEEIYTNNLKPIFLVTDKEMADYKPETISPWFETQLKIDVLEIPVDNNMVDQKAVDNNMVDNKAFVKGNYKFLSDGYAPVKSQSEIDLDNTKRIADKKAYIDFKVEELTSKIKKQQQMSLSEQEEQKRITDLQTKTRLKTKAFNKETNNCREKCLVIARLVDECDQAGSPLTMQELLYYVDLIKEDKNRP